MDTEAEAILSSPRFFPVSILCGQGTRFPLRDSQVQRTGFDSKSLHMETAQTVAPTDILTFRFISAYLVEGLQRPTGGSILLYSDASQGKKVLLTDNSYEGFHHFDTVRTINYISMTSILHARIWDLSQFRSYVSTSTQERLQHYGPDATFLVVEASHQEEAASIGAIGQSDERDFCCARPNGFRDQVESRHKTFLDQSQSFLSFSMRSVVGFQDAGSCILANHPSGKPLYILSSSMSVMPTLSAPIPADEAELCTTLFKHSVELRDFQTVFRLSAGSASNRRDNLRAFLFAFTALEVFVGKFSTQYRTQLDRLTEKDHSSKIHAHLERRRQDGNQHVLSYRFALVSSYLALGNLDNVIDEFGTANKCRNDIAHGRPFDEAALPTAGVRDWLGELVRLYIAHQDQPA